MLLTEGTWEIFCTILGFTQNKRNTLCKKHTKNKTKKPKHAGLSCI